MPQKKKTTSRAPSRSRSKSAGRATSKSRARSGSRGRPRSKTPIKRARTPASESKVKRRQSSSSERSPSPSLSSKLNANDNKSVAQRVCRSMASSKLQGIVKKIESGEFDSKPVDRANTKAKVQADLRPKHILLMEKFRQGPICYALMILTQFTMLSPFAVWANLNVYTPVNGLTSNAKDQRQTIFGPSYPFAWVLWPTDWHVYINAYSLLFGLLYIMVHYLFARSIPFGRRMSYASTPRRFDHKCNGTFVLFIMLTVAIASEYCDWLHVRGLVPSAFLPKYWLSLMVSSNLTILVLSILFYLLSKRTVRLTRQNVNQTSSIWSDFYHGRHRHVSWFGVDWKVILMRASALAVLLIEVALCYGQRNIYGRVSPALAFLTATHTIEVFAFVMFEHVYLSTYDVQSTTFGLEFILQRLAIPFIGTLTASYLYLHPDIGRMSGTSVPYGCNHYTITFAALIFLIGLWVFCRSNKQKDQSMREFPHPSISCIETLAGTGTPRLVVSGLWGLVRHPDYLGILLMNYAAVIPCGFISHIPWIFPIFSTIYLLHRTMIVEGEWLRRYGPMWQKYTYLVRCRLIPKIL